MSVLFISHSSHDNAVAAALGAQLRAVGYINLFLDFDPAVGIPAGRQWEKELYTQLEVCDGMVLLWGDRSAESKWCFAEITHARARDKRILPVKIGAADLPAVVTDLQFLDVSGSIAAGKPDFSLLIEYLKQARLPPRPFVLQSERPPYPGLMHFDESDAAVFFGRDKEVDRLRHELAKSRDSKNRFLVVLGASGSGKSSLVRAGVVPWLREDPRWTIVEPFRPGVAPFDALASAIAATFQRLGAARDWKDLRTSLEASADAMLATLHGGPPGALDEAGREQRGLEWAQDLRNVAGRREGAVLLVVDQLEEALTRNGGEQEAKPHTAEANRFLAILRAAGEWSGGSVIVLGVLRSDFLGLFQTAPPARGMDFVPIPVGPLPPERFKEVILRPAALSGVRVDPDLAETLVADTQVSDALPLLAFTLRELWEKYGDDNRLTLQEYREGLGGLQDSVARAAGEIIADSERGGKLGPATRRLLSRAFLEMVRIGAEGQITRRPLRWKDQPPEIHDLLRAFVRRRLLVSREQDGEPLLEVAHEALFRSWKAMAGLIAEHRDLLTWRRRVTDRVEDFQSTGALLAGPLLDEARRWRDRQRDLLSNQELALVEASERAERRAAWRVRMAVGMAFLTLASIGGVVLIQRRQAKAERARASGAETRASSAETAQRRLSAAAACNCALVRLTLPPGGRIVAIGPASPNEVGNGPQSSEDDELKVKADWFGDEVLLPPGDYRIIYAVGADRSRFGVHSDGVGKDRVIALPPIYSLPGFWYLAGGDCAEDPGVKVVPYFIANSDQSERLTWVQGNSTAFSSGARLPSEDELVCTARLGGGTLSTFLWRWAGTARKTLENRALLVVVSGREVKYGTADGLATVRLARSVSTDSRESQGQLWFVTPFSKEQSAELGDIVAKAWRAKQGSRVLLEGVAGEALELSDVLTGRGVPLDAVFVRENLEISGGVRASIERGVGAPSWRSVSQVPADARLRRVVIHRDKPTIEDPVTFLPSTARLASGSHRTLKSIAATLVGNPAILRVEIQGHVFEASPRSRLRLSERRAGVVRKELIKAGVAPDRLISKGYGDTKPLGCTRDLADLVLRDTGVEQMRASQSWSTWAEDEYLLGDLPETCRKRPSNGRVELIILKRSDEVLE